MILSPQNRALALAGSIGLAALLPGAWTLSTTPMEGIGINVADGTAQRLYEERFNRSFPAANSIRASWTALKFGLLGEVSQGAVLGRDGTLFTAEEFAWPQGAPEFSAELAVAGDRIAAAGAELIPIIVPDKSRMLTGLLPHERSARFQNRYDAALSDIATAGLRTVDLRPALTGEGLFMVTDTHWSPSGAKSAARAIAPLLVDKVTRSDGFATQPVGQVDFAGDLLAFANTGAWRPLVGPVFETIERHETLSPQPGGMDLFDAPRIEVVLVGTSFSAREDFHFDDFLREAIGADVLNFSLEGRGPFEPMTRFLESPDFSESPPAIVLWEIPERYLNTRSFK